MAEQQSIQSVERTFQVIEQLCANGEMSIAALAAGTKLHKATVFRILSTLAKLGYVFQNEKTARYALTLKFLQISALPSARFEMRTYARANLEQLSVSCGETVHLVERDGANVVYIDKFEAPQNSVRMVSQIGLALPIPLTAVGKAILAELTDAEIDGVWDRFDKQPRTANTITDKSRFLHEIEQVRQNGYAIDNEENEQGVRCVAAALPDISGRCRYAFSVSAPVSRMNDEALKTVAQKVLATKRQISGK